MRKLKLQVQLTVDGYMAGPNGEMDWMTYNWDEELKNYVGALTEPVDTIILGRKLAEGFIPYWADVALNAEHPEQDAGKKFTETPKVVFTKTLQQSQWANTILATGELVDEIKHLKGKEGKDIIAYGGAAFVSGLIKENLIDEYHLFINPVVIAGGLTIFRERLSYLNLHLVKATSFPCGIVVLHYVPKV